MKEAAPHKSMPQNKGIHYGWVIVIVGTLTIVACLGLARFAFGMLLPAMRDALSMSYDDMGLLGTANFAGYLVAVGATPLLLHRFSPRQLISCGLFLISGCILAIAISRSYIPVLILYTLVGIGSGLANIPLMVLVSYWFRRERRGQAAGLIVIGSGFAIIFSGFAIPYLNNRFGPDGWRAGWLLIALIVLLIALFATALIRNNPAEKGLEPVGKKSLDDYDPAITKGRFSSVQILAHLGALYFVFGATYVIYGTFIVTTMIEEYAFPEASAGHFWSWVGFFSLFSGTLFGTLSDRVGRKGGLMVVFSVQTLAYLLAGLNLGTTAVFGSVVLYGVAAFAIPAIMAAAVGDYLGKARAATGFSLITFCFAIGQTLGPAVAGMVAESSGTFTGSYLSSAALTGCAVILAFFLPPPGSHGDA
ncbi:MFS transporter [Malonomonas rubra]|uniref:MFS transporter n=1 Tax=Malonomonas rubra TaxID=57040 RepID=UPI0026F338E5|nr:MFS transporter [Malonomonas rubra]